MDNSPDIPSRKSPRRELQGPRPAPLNVKKDSHKIRKPPVAPQAFKHPQPPPRAPIIIYTVSPKIIHANPHEFMSLVQRLTGSNSSSTSSSSSSMLASSSSFQEHHQSSGGGGGGGAILSPAARYATIEKANTPDWKRSNKVLDVGLIEDMGISSKIERVSHFPSILSPNPSSLPPIPSNFFSPSSDANLLGFFSDLNSTGLHSNNNLNNYIEGSNNNNNSSSSILLPSPTNFIISPQMISPNIIRQALDLFDSLFD